MIFGAAIGWMEGEFAALGIPIKERGSRADEALELIRAIWTQEYPEVQTKRYRLSGVKASPLPLQKPRPPILVGGYSEGAFRRVARFGDGWHASSTDHEAFRQGIEAIQRFWKETGRDGAPVSTLRVALMIEGVHRAAVDMSLLRGRYAITGSVEKVIETLHGFKVLGCSHVALEVSYSTFPAILETIDILARQVRPELAEWRAGRLRNKPMRNSRPVYSTDGRIVWAADESEGAKRQRAHRSAPRLPDDGVVRIFRERIGRSGKVVTVVRGLTEQAPALTALAGDLKRLCGAGGTVKDRVIEIQGDQCEKVVEYLREQGYTVKLAGG